MEKIIHCQECKFYLPEVKHPTNEQRSFCSALDVHTLPEFGCVLGVEKEAPSSNFWISYDVETKSKDGWGCMHNVSTLEEARMSVENSMKEGNITKWKITKHIVRDIDEWEENTDND